MNALVMITPAGTLKGIHPLMSAALFRGPFSISTHLDNIHMSVWLVHPPLCKPSMRSTILLADTRLLYLEVLVPGDTQVGSVSTCTARGEGLSRRHVTACSKVDQADRTLVPIENIPRLHYPALHLSNNYAILHQDRVHEVDSVLRRGGWRGSGRGRPRRRGGGRRRRPGARGG